MDSAFTSVAAVPAVRRGRPRKYPPKEARGHQNAARWAESLALVSTRRFNEASVQNTFAFPHALSQQVAAVPSLSNHAAVALPAPITMKPDSPSQPPPQFPSATAPPQLPPPPPPQLSRLKSLIDNLALRCCWEDAIHKELKCIEQGMESARAALEELEGKKQELLAAEAQVRDKRLGVLQCLQDATSTQPEDGQLAESAASTKVDPPLGTGGTRLMATVSQVLPDHAPSSAVTEQLPANTLNVVVEDVQHYYRNGMTYLFFRAVLGRELINCRCFCNGRRSLVCHKKGSKNCSIMTAVPKDVRFTGQGQYPCTTTTCKRCQWCSTTSQETRTKLVCKACQVPLCLACFEPFYKKL